MTNLGLEPFRNELHLPRNGSWRPTPEGWKGNAVQFGNSTRCCKLFKLLSNTFATAPILGVGRPGKRE